MTDTGNHRVQNFDSLGTFRSQWGTEGSGDGQLNEPAGIAVDANGLLYVVDSGNHRVQRFTTSARSWTSGGPRGAGTDNFSALMV